MELNTNALTINEINQYINAEIYIIYLNTTVETAALAYLKAKVELAQALSNSAEHNLTLPGYYLHAWQKQRWYLRSLIPPSLVLSQQARNVLYLAQKDLWGARNLMFIELKNRKK